MPDLAIRPYAAADRASVHHIAADTAFFGDPVEAFMEDRRLFCDLVYAYYTDIEPEVGWVAALGTDVIGFVVGSVDTNAYRRRLVTGILPGVIGRLIAGNYRIGPKTRRYGRALVGSALRSETVECDLSRYPAHLHINVSEAARGHGAGRRLLTAFVDGLRERKVAGVHLHTTNLNIAACRLYVSAGFSLLDARPTYLWGDLISEPVESRCYGLRLAD